jgi:Zn/Cd-binding protein ZinT
MAQRDIIVRRVVGARAVPAPVGIPVVIPAVICRTLGKKTQEVESITRTPPGTDYVWIDRLKADTKLPLNEINDVEYVYTYTEGGNTYSFKYVFKRGVHFRFVKLKDQEAPEVEEYLPFENLYITDLKDGGTYIRYGIDWSQAPLLPSVEFEAETTQNGAGTKFSSGDYEIRVFAVSLQTPKTGSPYQYLVSQSVTKHLTIPSNTTAYIRVFWKKVDYVKGYIVEIKQIGGSTYQFFVNPHITDRVFSTEGATTMTYGLGGKQVPESNKDYTLNYKYLVRLVNQPVLYSAIEQVREDHGLGSEAYNIARYFLSTELGNAPFLVIVGVEEDSLAGYLNALKTLESVNCHLIFATYYGSDVLDLWDAMYQHCLALSDPITGQRERYAVFALENGIQWYDNELKTTLQHYRAMEGKGKRAFLVIFDGGEITLDTWIEQDGSITKDKKVIMQPFDITPLFGSMLTFARYCSFRDPASSLTEKSIPGLTFQKNSWGDDVYLYLRDLGAFVVRNDLGSAVVDLDINMSYGLLGLNDSQLPITMTEDWMKQDLRNKLKVFRGKKNVELRLASIINYIKLILDSYVSAGLITSYDEGSIKVEILSTGQLKGYFKYTPVIIINQILFEYDFEFIL